MPFETAIADFPTEAINRPLADLPAYTPWHLLDHIRYAQWDILDYIRNRDYLEATWPDAESRAVVVAQAAAGPLGMAAGGLPASELRRIV
jgi:hypothetical protein